MSVSLQLACPTSTAAAPIGCTPAGGLGKTTMALLLYNKLGSTGQFHKQAMVELALEGSGTEELERHLTKLLKALGMEEANGSISQLRNSLAELVRQHKVLLLLDNVNHSSQLDGLLSPTVVFSSGSRVIITSRDEALNGSKAYKVGGAVQDGLAVALHRCCLTYLQSFPSIHAAVPRGSQIT